MNRRMGFLACGMLLACGLLARGDNEASRPLVIEIKVPVIGVVTSEAELKKVKEVDISGVGVKLGIEASKVEANSGVLAYCWWTPEKDQTYSGLAPYQSMTLGPVAVKILKEGARSPSIQQRLNFTPQDAGAPQISVAPLRVTDPGKYTVSFYALDGTEIGQASIEVVQSGEPDWYPMTSSNDATVVKPAKVTATVAISPLRALPRWSADAYAKPGEPWRTFMPAAVNGDFKLAATNDTLTLTGKGPMAIGTVGNNLLARWWLNGKLVTLPNQGVRILNQMQDSTTLAGDVTMELKMEGVAALLKAKTGDKVEVQVLYSWFGWDYTMVTMLRARQAERTTGMPLKLSNKAEFVVK